MDRADIGLSKRLSLVLRHRPDGVGLAPDAAGWVAVGPLLEALTAHGPPVSRADLVRVVRTNDKQRFELDTDTDRIRARQGHSIPVELGLVTAEPPEVLYHGTPTGNLTSIMASGLTRQGRHHVHLSADPETAHRVGARRGQHVVLTIDTRGLRARGQHFWVTGNGVWLTDAVPADFLDVLE